MRTDTTLRPRELTSRDYPWPAIQQLMHYAARHRSYEAAVDPVRLHWFPNRVKIPSLGELSRTATSASIGARGTDYRNPLIAEIMYRLGFARKIGSGLPLAKAAMEANGNPPLEFEFSPTPRHGRTETRAMTMLQWSVTRAWRHRLQTSHSSGERPGNQLGQQT